VLLHRVRRQLVFDHRADERADRWWCSYVRRPGAFFLLALSSCVVALIPLAYANPPDPLWIAGIYDAADYDDVILAAVSLESLVEESLLDVSRVSIVAGILVIESVAMLAANTLGAVQPRAPPQS
jgi:hypothetical protein